MTRPILCLDFDGVIHDYKKGWQDGKIYGNVTEGFFEWATKAQTLFQLVIYSSRSKTPESIGAMETWMKEQWNKWDGEGIHWSDFDYADKKPPAFLTIDDRAITFHGAWDDALDPETLRAFKPWNALTEKSV